MNVLTYADICHAIADDLRAQSFAERVMAFDEIEETIPDLPCLHIYPDSGEVDSGGNNDRAVFDASRRRTELTLYIDGYARQRSNLSEDLKAQMALIDAIDAWLCRQTNPPYLGVAGLKAFHWRWERTTFPFGGGEIKTMYAGCQFTLTLVIF